MTTKGFPVASNAERFPIPPTTREKSWRRLPHEKNDIAATQRRRFDYTASGCDFSKLIYCPHPASEFVQRLACQWCEEVVEMQPAGSRPLEVYRRQG